MRGNKMLTLIKGGLHPDRTDKLKELVDIDSLIELAEEFGLPLMIVNGEILIEGEESTVVFSIVSKNKCQLGYYGDKAVY